MTAHPIDLAVPNNVRVSKPDLRGYEKERNRVRVADAAEVNNTDFSGQFGGLFVADLTTDFDIDTSDTTTPDDGLTCLVDLAGNRFKAVVPTVPSIAPNYREVTAAGDITVGPSDDVIGVNKTVGAATNVDLGLASGRSGKPLVIKDIKGDADVNNITPVASGGELIDGLAASAWAIVSPFGTLKLYPRSGGWYTAP